MLGRISLIPSPLQIRCRLYSEVGGGKCCDQYKNTDWTATNFSMFHHDVDYVIISCIQVNIKADMNLIFIKKMRFHEAIFCSLQAERSLTKIGWFLIYLSMSRRGHGAILWLQRDFMKFTILMTKMVLM